MAIIDWPAIKERLNPPQPPAQPLAEFRTDQLGSIGGAPKSNGLRQVFAAVYAGPESDKMAAGIAFFEPVWEQTLAQFFGAADPRPFSEQFADFDSFCARSGWEDNVHGSARIRVKLALYAILVLGKTPPVPPRQKGFVEQVLDTITAVIAAVGNVLEMLGIDPEEARTYLVGLVKLLI